MTINKTQISLKKELIINPSFHEVDPMGVVWHGNYLKFFEKAREALFKDLHFGYAEMKQSDMSGRLSKSKSNIGARPCWKALFWSPQKSSNTKTK